MRKANYYMKFFCKAFLCMLVAMCIAANVQAQDADKWREQQITLRVSNQPLGKVLEMAAQAANAKITLQGVTLVNINKPTSIVVKDKPLDKVIGELIGDQNVKIRFEDNREIIIEPYEQKSRHRQGVQCTGNGYRPRNRRGACGCYGYGYRRHRQGPFGLYYRHKRQVQPTHKQKESLRVTFVGYEPLSKQILKPESNLIVELKPSFELDEVVVTGISKRNKNSFTGNFVEVKGAELRKMNPTSILKGLQFFDPSFKVIENNSTGSDPNAEPEFQIRGDQSLAQPQ